MASAAIFVLSPSGGKTNAPQELFNAYAKYFLKIIRRRLDSRLRTLYDSVDFMQETRRLRPEFRLPCLRH